MALYAQRAAMTVKYLSGTEAHYLIGILSFCTTYYPYTGETQAAIGERIGQDPSRSSKSFKGLVAKGEIAYQDNKIYILRLDNFQLKEIHLENYDLLQKLALLGCLEAARMVVERTRDEKLLEGIVEKYSNLKIQGNEKDNRDAREISESATEKLANLTTKVVDSTSVNRFLTLFFLSQNLSKQTEYFPFQNPDVVETNRKLSDSTSPLKDLNGMSLNPNGKLKEEEGHSPPPPPPPKKINDQNFSDGAARAAEGKNRNATNSADEAPKRAEGGLKAADKVDSKELRNDISIDDDWVGWLQTLEKYRKIDVFGLYAKMLKKSKRPTRFRLLCWLVIELESIPITAEFLPAKLPENGNSGELKPLDETGFQRAIEELADFAAGEELAAFEKYYLPADWSRIIQHLGQ